MIVKQKKDNPEIFDIYEEVEITTVDNKKVKTLQLVDSRSKAGSEQKILDFSKQIADLIDLKDIEEAILKAIKKN